MCRGATGVASQGPQAPWGSLQHLQHYDWRRSGPATPMTGDAMGDLDGERMPVTQRHREQLTLRWPVSEFMRLFGGGRPCSTTYSSRRGQQTMRGPQTHAGQHDAKATGICFPPGCLGPTASRGSGRATHGETWLAFSSLISKAHPNGKLMADFGDAAFPPALLFGPLRCAVQVWQSSSCPTSSAIYLMPFVKGQAKCVCGCCLSPGHLTPHCSPTRQGCP